MSSRERTAAAMKAAFDASFSHADLVRAEHRENLLAVRIGDAPYALRLAEIGGLHADLPVVRIPSPLAALRGIAGLRGEILPVYDLAALLGHSGIGATRWLVLARSDHRVGFAFERFESHMCVDKENVTAADPQGARPHVRGTVCDDYTMRPIVSIASVLEAISRAGRSGQPQEGS